MFIEFVPNRGAAPTVLLRESYRGEAGKAQKRMIANLTKAPAALIAGISGLLKGGRVAGSDPRRARSWQPARPIPS